MSFDHIIITTQDFPPSTGGIQTWCVELAKSFSKLDYKVTVITKSFEGYNEEPFHFKGVNVIRLPHEKWRNQKNFLILKCLKSINTEKSILLASNWKMAVPAMVYNIRNNLPYFSVCHGLDAIEKRRKNNILQKLTFKRSWGTIAVSQFTRKLMKSNKISVPIDVINNGVDLSNFTEVVPSVEYQKKYSFDENKFNILNVGRLEKRKGYDKTIEAIAGLPDVVFHIGGKGNYENRLRELTIEKSVQDRVLFHGFIPEEDMNALYSMADLFVMPSRNVNDSVEGFGITYLEAAACGTPSVGGVNTGAEDAIEHNKSGILVDGNNVESIQRAIEMLKDNPDKLHEMAAYVKDRVKNFTWDKIALQFVNLFKSKI